MNLYYTKTDDATLRALQPLKHLKTLALGDLKGTKVTDNGLALLRFLPQLEALSLLNLEITDSVLASLAAIAVAVIGRLLKDFR